MTTNTLQTPLGNLQYQAINMIDVDIAVAKWKADNPSPKVPLIRQKWSGTETGRLITESMRIYGKHSNRISRKQKKALKDEITQTLPMVKDPYDKQYTLDKEDYANRVYLVHWQAVISSGVVADKVNEKLLALLLSYDIAKDKQLDDEVKATEAYKRSTYRFMIYDTIIKSSCVTADVVHNCLLALDRYYKGEPFLEVLERRSKKVDPDIPSENFRHSIHDLFIKYELLPHAESLPIDERSMLAARLLSRANMEVWSSEDMRATPPMKGVQNLRGFASR